MFLLYWNIKSKSIKRTKSALRHNYINRIIKYLLSCKIECRLIFYGFLLLFWKKSIEGIEIVPFVLVG